MALIDGARVAVGKCMGVRKGEVVAVITDTEKESIGRAIFQAAQEKKAEAVLVVMDPRKHHGQEPPDAVANLMKGADVVIAPTLYSLSHTQARKAATEQGARIATMPSITARMMSTGGMTADFNAVSRRADKMHKTIRRFKQFRLTTPLGTDITFEVDRKGWIKDTGIIKKKEEFGNLPAGEIFIAPLEGSAEGTFIVDGAIAGEGKVDKPITVLVEKGRAVKISGAETARKLRNNLQKAGKELSKPDLVNNIAEFGIGLNPNAKIIGNPLEDEKVMGTVHIALGDNSTFGGKVKAGIHIDGIITEPTLVAGKKTFIKDGALKV